MSDTNVFTAVKEYTELRPSHEWKVSTSLTLSNSGAPSSGVMGRLRWLLFCHTKKQEHVKGQRAR